MWPKHTFSPIFTPHTSPGSCAQRRILVSPRQKPLGGKGGGVNEVSEGQQLGWPKADQERIRSDGKAQMWEVKRTELACKRGKEERGRAQT